MVTYIYTACHPERRLSYPAERESEAAVEGSRKCLRNSCCITEFS
jgi:hypothetical protein